MLTLPACVHLDKYGMAEFNTSVIHHNTRINNLSKYVTRSVIISREGNAAFSRMYVLCSFFFFPTV